MIKNGQVTQNFIIETIVLEVFWAMQMSRKYSHIFEIMGKKGKTICIFFQDTIKISFLDLDLNNFIQFFGFMRDDMQYCVAI